MIDLPLVDSPARSSSESAWDDPADWHSFESNGQRLILVADGSRVYELDDESFELLATATAVDDAHRLLGTLGIPFGKQVSDAPLSSPQTRALSLAISQKCNLACTYCYAQEGSFGGAAKAMPTDVAFRAIDFLLAQATEGERVNVSFLGGEPLMARETLRETVEYAQRQSQPRNIRVGFSITTNGTLVTPTDAEFFANHGFAVTVSLDGIGATHDRLRPHKNGSSTFSKILDNIQVLLCRQGALQVSARVTVTPQNLNLPETLTELIAFGFHSVGFSPMLASPTGRDEMNSESLQTMLEQMIACGRLFEQQIEKGIRFPFSNMVSALTEIHRGTHRPYPCGAGAGYLGVSADGELSACHRFVEDDEGSMGNLDQGIDRAKQNRWLSERHVHRQEPCRSCWARYLCGGGCHHEVLKRGRPSCNYIRGWLHYCLGAYVRLQALSPSFFE